MVHVEKETSEVSEALYFEIPLHTMAAKAKTRWWQATFASIIVSCSRAFPLAIRCNSTNSSPKTWAPLHCNSFINTPWPYNYKYLALQQHLRCFNLKNKEDQLPEILQKLINSDYSLGQYFKQVMGCCSGNPSPASPCLEIFLAFATSNELLFPRLAGRNQHQYASTKTPLPWSFASQPKIESSAPSCMKRNRYTVKSESMSLWLHTMCLVVNSGKN